MYKGLFWLVENSILVTYKIPCNADGIPDDPLPAYNSRRGNSFTHKATWVEAVHGFSREVRSKPWNYYPRGRVEIKSGKAIVFHNPALASPQFEQRICEEFDLDSILSIRFVPDHSIHYRSIGK